MKSEKASSALRMSVEREGAFFDLAAEPLLTRRRGFFLLSVIILIGVELVLNSATLFFVVDKEAEVDGVYLAHDGLDLMNVSNVYDAVQVEIEAVALADKLLSYG